MGKAILEVLKQLYGNKFLQRIMGTKANVVKPKEFDINAPTKNIYSKDAFKNEELLEKVDEQIMEYAPYILSNRNAREQANFLENAKQLLKAKKKEPEVINEADVLDIKTGKKIKEEGIISLKDELGLPPQISPKSEMGKILQETKRLGKEKEIVEKDTMSAIDEAMESFFARTATKDVAAEGKRRAVMRNILLKDKKLNLPAEIRKSLENYDDLRGGGDQSMDPLALFNKYYKRDDTKLGQLDDIIDTAEDEFKAADKFLKDTEFELKEKSFDDKLKDLPDDIPDMAEGGRIVMGIGGLIGKFTKSEVLIQMLENTLKGSKDPYVKKNFPTFIKELQKNPELANDPNVWKQFTTGLPKNQRLVVHSDDSVDFFTQSEFGPQNIETITAFQKKYPFLSREEATKITKMEPEDQILEVTRLERIYDKNLKQKNIDRIQRLRDQGFFDKAEGGRVGMAKGGLTGKGLDYLMGV